MIRLSLAITLIAMTSVIAIFQILIGSSISVTISLTISAMLAIPAILNRKTTPAEIILLGLSFYLGIGSLIFKSLLGQNLDQNLIAPNETASALTLTTISIAIGYIASRIILPNTKDVFGISGFFSRGIAVSAISTPLAIASLFIYVLNIYLTKGGGETADAQSFGGLASFSFLPALSACLLYSQASTNKNYKTWIFISLFFSTMLFCSFISNEKRPIVDFGLATFISFIFNDKLRPKLPILMILAILCLPGLIIISSALEATRTAGRSLPPMDRAKLTWDLIIDSGFELNKISQKRDLSASSMTYSYKQNLSYYFPSTINADRYSLIFPLDQIIRRNPQRITLNQSYGEFARIIPSGIIKKDNIAFVDQIAWYFRIRRTGSIARPVLGTPAAAYAVWGLPGVIIVPGATFFLIFLTLRIATLPLRNNPISIAISVISLILVEWDFVRITAFYLRPLWVIVIFILLLRIISTYTPSYRRWKTAADAALKKLG